MDTDSGALAAILLGFLLGLKHATDADHVIAISTVVKEYKNAFKGLWVGISWGLGHTCLLYTSPSPRDRTRSRMPSSA